MAKKRQSVEKFDATNLDCARSILADPARYGGEESGMVRWARLVVQRITGERAPLLAPGRQTIFSESSPRG